MRYSQEVSNFGQYKSKGPHKLHLLNYMVKGFRHNHSTKIADITTILYANNKKMKNLHHYWESCSLYKKTYFAPSILGVTLPLVSHDNSNYRSECHCNRHTFFRGAEFKKKTHVESEYIGELDEMGCNVI